MNNHVDSYDKKTSSALSKKEIIEKIFERNINNRLVITPLIDLKTQINHGSIDVRLGNEFIILKRTKIHLINPIDNEQKKDIKKMHDHIYVRPGDPFIIHPHQFVLGSTLEYFKLPDDIIGYIVGRSSWGRIGLIIATATMINAGFSGVITLELSNIGETPIALYGNSRIAQISFHTISKSKYPDKRKKFISKYSFSIGPEESRIYDDTEWNTILNISN